MNTGDTNMRLAPAALAEAFEVRDIRVEIIDDETLHVNAPAALLTDGLKTVVAAHGRKVVGVPEAPATPVGMPSWFAQQAAILLSRVEDAAERAELRGEFEDTAAVLIDKGLSEEHAEQKSHEYLKVLMAHWSDALSAGVDVKTVREEPA